MPRSARRASITGTYHVILRGINQQIIFEEERDYQKCIHILKQCQEKNHFLLHAYCLMDNHIHLLLTLGDNDLGIIFRSFGAQFVYWYNAKYQRSGHLFQDRFHSEAVENERYFLTAIRYIHQNPVQVGLVNNPNDYKWSSSAKYFSNRKTFVEKQQAIKFAGGLDNLQKFLLQPSEEKCLDVNEGNRRLTDDDGILLRNELTGCTSPGEFQRLEKEVRNSYLKELHTSGLSVRQLVRLCGISKSTIERALGMRR